MIAQTIKFWGREPIFRKMRISSDLGQFLLNMFIFDSRCMRLYSHLRFEKKFNNLSWWIMFRRKFCAAKDLTLVSWSSNSLWGGMHVSKHIETRLDYSVEAHIFYALLVANRVVAVTFNFCEYFCSAIIYSCQGQWDTWDRKFERL